MFRCDSARTTQPPLASHRRNLPNCSDFAPPATCRNESQWELPDDFDTRWNKSPVGLRWVESRGFNLLFGQLHCRDFASMLYPTLKLVFTLAGVMVMFAPGVGGGETAAGVMTFLKFCEAAFFGIYRPYLDASESQRDTLNTATLYSLVIMGMAGAFLTTNCVSPAHGTLLWPCFMLLATASIMCTPVMEAYDSWEWAAFSSPVALDRREKLKAEAAEESSNTEEVDYGECHFESRVQPCLSSTCLLTRALHGRIRRERDESPKRKKTQRGTSQRCRPHFTLESDQSHPC